MNYDQKGYIRQLKAERRKLLEANTKNLKRIAELEEEQKILSQLWYHYKMAGGGANWRQKDQLRNAFDKLDKGIKL